MFKMLLPIALIVVANAFYNLSAKYTSAEVNSFLSLTAAYTTAALVTFLVYCFTGSPRQLPSELTKLNWAPFVMGLASIGLELGYIYMYRAGWKVSTGPLVANISIACVLLLVGALFLKEVISLRQITGMALCLCGLIVITK